MADAFTPEDFTPQSIAAVRNVVSEHTRRTPLIFSPWLSDAAGSEVWLKCENLQVTGSFKIRGAVAAVSRLAASGTERVIASSTGNHGAALAHAARQFGLSCLIVVPRSTPLAKQENIRSAGAEIMPAPFDGYDFAARWMHDNRDRFGGTIISPFEDPWVVAGNGGTTGAEIFEDLPACDTIVTPCGGGGLAVGLGLAAQAVHKSVRVIGVNSEASPGMYRSRSEGKACLVIESKPTLADGTEGGVGKITYALGLRYIQDVVTVREAGIAQAMGQLAERHKMIVEGAGALGPAALLNGLTVGTKTVVVLSGSNIGWPQFLEAVSGRS